MTQFVCRISELKEREPLALEVEGTSVGIVLVKGELYAYENTCPHQGGPVCLGEVFPRTYMRLDEEKRELGEYVSPDELEWVCPWHGMTYDLFSGQCVTDSELRLRKVEAFLQDEKVYVEIEGGKS